MNIENLYVKHSSLACNTNRCFFPLNKVPLVKACRFLRLLVLYLYSCKMVVLGILERLACEKRMIAKYSTCLLIDNYILLVKQNMETFFTNAVCFLGLTRIFSLLITSLILLEYDPEAFSRG